ncbi:MAG: fasciclin domain-containing protein [Bacteroides xylanisolvens]
MKNNVLLSIIAGILGICFLNACEDSMEGTVYRTSDEQMLDEYMEDPKNQLTDFLKIVDASDYRGMLHAYGAYTCLIPTNSAVQKYMESVGKTVEQLTQEEANEYVGYHVISDTITSARFVDGRMPTQNIIDYYLTTESKYDDAGNLYVEVDRKARMIAKDIILGNGILHVVDAMLEKPHLTLKQQIESLPLDRYSLMKDLFAETSKFDDLLDAKIEGDTCYTVYIQDNETFNMEGIYNKDDLLRHLKKNLSGIGDQELLENFLGYHIGVGRQYVVDLMQTSAITTAVPLEVISCKMQKDKILLNEYKIGSLDEEGIELDRESEYSDLSAVNGVVQEVKGMLEIKKLAAYPVYFDVCDQPELKKMSFFRKKGTSEQFTVGSLSEVTWATNKITYKVLSSYDPSAPTVANNGEQYVYGDYFQFRMADKYPKWIEFKLPLLAQGVYKVWICFQYLKADSGAPQLRTTFKKNFNEESEDDLVLPNIVMAGKVVLKYRIDENGKKVIDHAAMEQEGMKIYTPYAADAKIGARLLGTIKVEATGRYALRLECLIKAGADIQLDMLQFIPAEEEQIWPMVDMAGNLIEEDTPKNEMWPYK